MMESIVVSTSPPPILAAPGSEGLTRQSHEMFAPPPLTHSPRDPITSITEERSGGDIEGIVDMLNHHAESDRDAAGQEEIPEPSIDGRQEEEEDGCRMAGEEEIAADIGSDADDRSE